MIKSKYFQFSKDIFIENSFTRWYYFHSNIYVLPMKRKYLRKPSIDLTYDIVTSGQIKLISKINFANVSAFRFNESITHNKNLHYEKTFPSKLEMLLSKRRQTYNLRTFNSAHCPINMKLKSYR